MDETEMQQADDLNISDEPQNEFQTLKERLAEIATLVDSEDISLDQALDLYEEAVVLGLQATDLLDVDITAQEEAQTRILEEDAQDDNAPDLLTDNEVVLTDVESAEADEEASAVYDADAEDSE